jgi:hypothetical protein
MEVSGIKRRFTRVAKGQEEGAPASLCSVLKNLFTRNPRTERSLSTLLRIGQVIAREILYRQTFPLRKKTRFTACQDSASHQERA